MGGGLWAPTAVGGQGDLHASFSSTGTTRVASNWGTAITPGNNTMGTYTQILTAGNVSFDVFGIAVLFCSGATSAASRDIIADVGADPAGGSSYSIILPQLLCSQAAGMATGSGGPGLHYYFPLWVKSGSTIAVRASVNNGTVGTVRAAIRIFGAPKDRRTVRVASRVMAYGITAGSSTGTAVTSGQASEGTWTSLGTIAAADNPWFWQYSMGIGNGTCALLAYSADLGIGDASNKFVVCEDRVFQTNTAEQLADDGTAWRGAYQAKGSDIVYGRLQCSGTPDTGLTMAAWGAI